MSDFTVGGVFREFFGLFRRHWVVLLLSALLLVALPRVLGDIAVLQSPPTIPVIWRVLPFGLYFLGGTLFQIVAYRALLSGAEGWSSSEAIRAGLILRLFFPVLAISILAAIGFGLAALLLLVPAAILACRWFVVVPVGVAENIGIFQPFRRSATLTEGFRWRIFGVLLLSAVITFVVALVLGFVIGFLAALGHVGWAKIAIDGVTTVVTQVPIVLAAAATYIELRRVKEGTLSREFVDAFA